LDDDNVERTGTLSMQKKEKEKEIEEESYFDIPYNILVWKCPKCNDVVVSKSNEHHKLDSCKCGSCYVDLEEYYFRFGFKNEVGKPIILFNEKNIPFEYLREIQTWGVLENVVFDKIFRMNFEYPIYHYKPIFKLSFEHILNILKTQNQISPYLRRLFEEELSFRLSNKSILKAKIGGIK
jgi:hypothetical protein